MPGTLTTQVALPKPPSSATEEPDYDTIWKDWKAAPPDPATNARTLRSLDPLIDRAAKTHVGDVNPLVRSRARSLALQSLQTYDPNKGRFQSHFYNQMQGLKRYSAQTAQGVRVPERVVLDRRALDMAEGELRDRLGRDPTDDELADHSGFNVRRIQKVRGYSPAMSQGYFSQLGEDGGGFEPGVNRSTTAAWEQLILDDLNPVDRKIFDYHRQGMSNQQIAAKLRRSAGLISQRKAVIQKLLDQEQELSPFQ